MASIIGLEGNNYGNLVHFTVIAASSLPDFGVPENIRLIESSTTTLTIGWTVSFQTIKNIIHKTRNS